MFFKDKRVALTGPNSMIGIALREQLCNLGATVCLIPHNQFDLLKYEDALSALDWNIDYCFHLGGWNGNLKFNEKYPADIYYRTAQMGLNVLKACQEMGIKKVCSLISSCAYSPDYPLSENYFFKGSPHESVEAHGFAKKTLIEFGRQLHKQYKIDCINICVNHVYGPNDSFNPEKTKVMGSLIKKFSDAKKNNATYVELWGTGQVHREFIYVDDVAKYICLAFEKYNDSRTPLNIAAKEEISIADLAQLIKETVGYDGEIRWNGWPDGQKSKLLENDKMKRILGELRFTEINEGVRKTVEWYNENILRSSN